MNDPSPLPESSAPPILPAEPTAPDVAPAAPVIIQDEEAGPSDQEARQQAFDAQHTWQGQELHPFSFNRESLFYQHRAAVGAPDIDTAVIDQDAFLADAARILWLCAHTPDDIRVHRTRPVLMQEEIERWAETKIPRGTRAAAASLAMQIWQESAVTIAVPSDQTSDSGN